MAFIFMQIWIEDRQFVFTMSNIDKVYLKNPGYHINKIYIF